MGMHAACFCGVKCFFILSLCFQSLIYSLVRSPTGFWNLQNIWSPHYKTSLRRFKTNDYISCITWYSGIVDEDVESFLLLKNPISKFPDRDQRRQVHQMQVDVRVSGFLLDFFKCGFPPRLASTGQDNTGSTTCKVQGNELPDPCQGWRREKIILDNKKMSTQQIRINTRLFEKGKILMHWWQQMLTHWVKSLKWRWMTFKNL